MIVSKRRVRIVRLLSLFVAATPGASLAGVSPDKEHADLIELHAEWRAFERPPLKDGAPDYTTATFAARGASATRSTSRITTPSGVGRSPTTTGDE